MTRPYGSSPQEEKRYRLASYGVRSRFLEKLIAAIATFSVVLAMRGPVTWASAQPSPVEFTGQTTTVLANPTGQSGFSLELNPGGAPSTATVTTQLFAHLSTRSGFLAALSGRELGNQIAATSALALTCLPATAGGSRQLTIDVTTSSTTPTTLPGGCTGQTTPPSFNLHCAVGTGSCNGVYPLLVTVNANGAVFTHFITFLTYVERPAATPLNVATVFTAAPTATTEQIDALTHALASAPSIKTDVGVEPKALQSLEGTSSLRSLGQLLTQNPSVHEMTRLPYVPLDPGTLQSSGLQGDIQQQLDRAQQLATANGFPIPSPASPWLGTAPVTQTTTSALAGAGITTLVVPDSSLAQPTDTSLNWGEPFTLTPGSPQVTALAGDAALSAELRPTSQPALAAEQFLADVAFLHFERPSLTTPQGVVAVSPYGWVANQTYLTTLFAGLTDNPIATSATLTSLFSTLPIGGNGGPTTRALAVNGQSSSWPATQLTTFQQQQLQQSAFESAIRKGNAVIESLRDSAFSVESDHLTNGNRLVALGTMNGALTEQLSKFTIDSGDITLTALSGTLPITVTSTASYTLDAILRISNTQLTFPYGTTTHQTIDRSSISVRLPVQGKTSGDFPFTATLLTPQGNLTVTSQRITARINQSSIVGVILTIGALVVLFAWWIRTWQRNRSTRRA